MATRKERDKKHAKGHLAMNTPSIAITLPACRLTAAEVYPIASGRWVCVAGYPESEISDVVWLETGAAAFIPTLSERRHLAG